MGLPSSELRVLFGASCSIDEDPSVDNGFAKMSDLGIGGVAPFSVDRCSASDLESEVDSCLRVTVN